MTWVRFLLAPPVATTVVGLAGALALGLAALGRRALRLPGLARQRAESWLTRRKLERMWSR